MNILGLSFAFYFMCLILFCFISHPVYYCGLLVVNSVVCSFICYYIYGFSWYSLIMCLVYIGGVYILFIFVSVYSPNNSVVWYLDLYNLVIHLALFVVVTIGTIYLCLNLNMEFSSSLCNLVEGYFYVCLCLTLAFGFIVLSLIMSINFNFYR